MHILKDSRTCDPIPAYAHTPHRGPGTIEMAIIKGLSNMTPYRHTHTLHTGPRTIIEMAINRHRMARTPPTSNLRLSVLLDLRFVPAAARRTFMFPVR